MIKFLTSKWMAPPIGVLAYVLATVLCWKTPTLPPAVKNASTAKQAKPSWEFTNPEAEQLIEELKQEKRALELRQKQLDDTAKGLEAERSEMTKVSQSVRKLQKDFDQIVLRVQDEEVANLKRLAKMYAAMTPETAASIFAQMDDPAIVKIVLFMKDAEASAVLESFSKKGEPEAKRVAAITERLKRSTSHNPPPAK
jgi:flagellar motility protein MotE (MotC chaperone)